MDAGIPIPVRGGDEWIVMEILTLRLVQCSDPGLDTILGRLQASSLKLDSHEVRSG